MVDVTIRNMDAEVLKKMKIRAAEDGVTLGEEVTRAANAFLTIPRKKKSVQNFLKLKPVKGLSPDLSLRIDEFAFED